MYKIIRYLIVCAVGVGLAGEVAWAEDPKFVYGDSKDLKDVEKAEWKASAQVGLLMTTGNSQTATGSGALDLSRKEGNNKLAVDVKGTYARSTVIIAVDGNGDGVVQENEISRSEVTSAKSYETKARYDRFFTDHDSAFLSARAGADFPAGKDLLLGAQVGYARQLYKSERHALAGEAGYDFSYERYVASGTEPLNIHSARLFLGYKGTLNKATGVFADVEALFNLNSETSPTPGAEDIGAFEDMRIHAKTGLTTQIFGDLSFRFSFAVQYDRAPAPAPLIGGLPYAPGFVPLADTLDTTTELALVVSFL